MLGSCVPVKGLMTCSQVCGFIAQLVERRTGIAEASQRSRVRVPSKPPEFFKCLQETVAYIIQLSARIDSTFRL